LGRVRYDRTYISNTVLQKPGYHSGIGTSGGRSTVRSLLSVALLLRLTISLLRRVAIPLLGRLTVRLLRRLTVSLLLLTIPLLRRLAVALLWRLAIRLLRRLTGVLCTVRRRRCSVVLTGSWGGGLVSWLLPVWMDWFISSFLVFLHRKGQH
jgi:hypothetical protein